MAKMGKLEIVAERKVKMVELDVNADDKTIDTMAKIGLRMIKKDRAALFNYAFVKAIEHTIGK